MLEFEINGASLACVDRGSGGPIVLVHGSFSDWRTWAAQLDDLSLDYRAFAYSRRYHWPNEAIPGEAEYSMAEHVDDLKELLHALGAGPVHLVGHSYGALVALLLAIGSPGLIRTLVLAEPPVVTLSVSSSPTLSELLRLLVQSPRTALAILKFGGMGVVPAANAARRGDTNEAIRLSGTAVLGRKAFLGLSAKRLEQVRANYIRQELLGSDFPELDEEILRGLDTPTLLVNGEHSPVLFHLLMDRLEETLPQTQRVEIPEASHIVHEDNPTAFNAALRSFLKGVADHDLSTEGRCRRVPGGCHVHIC